MIDESLTNDDISEVADYELRAIGNTHPAVAIKIIELKKLRSAVLGLKAELIQIEQNLADSKSKPDHYSRMAYIITIDKINHWLGAVLEEKE